nr:MAG TPA: hypothetical protein [Bacteriophage sp.]
MYAGDTCFEFAAIRNSPPNPASIKPLMKSLFAVVRLRPLTTAPFGG